MPQEERSIFDEIQDDAEEERNRFFEDPGVNVSTALGALDLVFGAPARAVQSVLIDLVDDEPDSFFDVVSNSAGNLVGVGEDGFGRGNASGIKLLKELGALEDEESIGNIIAGAGVDIATDLATLNFIGAARKAVTKTGRFGQLIRADVQKNLRGKRRLVQNRKETIDLIEAMGRGMDFEARKQFTGGDSQLFARIFERVKGPDGKDLENAFKFKKGVAAKLDPGDFQVRYKGDALDKLQDELILKPTAGQIGAVEVDRIRKVLGENFSLESGFARSVRLSPGDFEFSFSKPVRLLRRESTNTLDVRFNRPDFLKRRVAPPTEPNNPLVMTLKTVPLERVPRLIPAHLSPFDFKAVHRKTGIFDVMAPRYNAFKSAMERDLKELDDLATSIKLRVDSPLDNQIGRAIENEAEFLKLTPQQQKFYDKVYEIEDRLARTQITDARTGRVGDALNPDHRASDSRYFHRIPAEREPVPLVGDNWLLETDGGARIDLRDMSGINRDIQVGAFMKRAGDEIDYSPSILKSAKAYIASVNKKIHLEPGLQEIAPIVRGLRAQGEHGLYKSAQDMVGMFFGQYSNMDRHFDNLISKIPGLRNAPWIGRPMLATRMSVAANATSARGILGVNPRTTLLQTFQGIVNNSMHLGLWDSMAGWFRVTTRTGGRGFNTAFRDLKIMNQAMKAMDHEFTHVLGHRSRRFLDGMDSVLFKGINGMDNLNRGAAFHGGVSLARRHGLSDAQAALQGIAAANETQFLYGKLGAASLRNNPLGRVLLQFQSFAAKQLSFMAGQARRDPGTNFLRYLAISGMVSRNLSGHIDISSELAPTTPGDVRDIVTMKRIPALQGANALLDFAWAAAQEASGSGLGKKAIDSGFAIEQLKRAVFSTMVPGGGALTRAGKYLPTITDFIPAEEFVGPIRTGAKGEEVDRFGRKIRDLTQEEAIVGLAGFRSDQARIDREKVNDIRFQSQLINRQYQRYMQEATRAQINGRNPRPWLVEAQKIKMMKGKALMQAFKSRLRNRRMSLEERTRLRAPEVVKRGLQ